MSRHCSMYEYLLCSVIICIWSDIAACMNTCCVLWLYVFDQTLQHAWILVVFCNYMYLIRQCSMYEYLLCSMIICIWSDIAACMNTCCVLWLYVFHQTVQHVWILVVFCDYMYLIRHCSMYECLLCSVIICYETLSEQISADQDCMKITYAEQESKWWQWNAPEDNTFLSSEFARYKYSNWFDEYNISDWILKTPILAPTSLAHKGPNRDPLPVVHLTAQNMTPY